MSEISEKAKRLIGAATFEPILLGDAERKRAHTEQLQAIRELRSYIATLEADRKRLEWVKGFLHEYRNSSMEDEEFISGMVAYLDGE